LISRPVDRNAGQKGSSVGSLSFTLANGSTANVHSNGSIHSAVGGVSYEEPDGNGGTVTVDTTPTAEDDRRHYLDVQAFKESRQYRQAVRILRATPARAAGRPRQRGAGRPRAQAARSSARSGDSPDSDEPPPQGDGRRALLRRLIRRGLRADSIEEAALLIVALDEYAAADREAVA
jgi:hypothetical protein